MTSVNISQEEQEQILQTIEIFEVITQSNPNDLQSLEILKEAYWQLGRDDEALTTARRLADSYMQTGQYSSALLEYEGILQKRPDSAEIINLLADVERKLKQPGSEGLEVDPLMSEGSLITTSATRQDKKKEPVTTSSVATSDGNEPLAKFFIQHRIVPEEATKATLEKVKKEYDSLQENMLAPSLIHELAISNAAPLESMLCGILDRTKFAYIPLDRYDIDRQIVKMLPETLTLGRLIVPFDLISRTVMIAMANPFDSMAKEAVQQLLDYNIQWHLASPEAIFKILRDTYRIE